MVSLKIYVTAYILVAARTIYGFNSAVHVSGLRGGFERGVTRGAMPIGDLVLGVVGHGLDRNAPGPGKILVGKDVFGRSVNSGAFNARLLSSTRGGVGGLVRGGRGIVVPLNGGLKSQADGGIDRGRGAPSGHREEFNAGTIINERSRLGEQGLNGEALSGSGGGWKVVVLNGGFGGGLDGKSGDAGSHGIFDSMSRVATMPGGNAVSSPVNSDQSSNADFSGKFDRLGRHNSGVNGLENIGFRQGRINGGFSDEATGRILPEGLRNGRVDAERWEPGGFGVGGSGESFNGGLRRADSRVTDISRREFVGESGPGQEFNNETLFNQISIADIRGIHDGVLGDGGAIGGQRRSGDILKVVVVNGGFGSLDTGSTGGLASVVRDSNVETSTLSTRRPGSNEQKVRVRNPGSVVGDGGRDLKRGAISTGEHQTRSSGRILTNLLQIVSNLVNDLESVSGASLGDLGSNGKVGILNDGNGFNDPSRDGFTSGGSPNPTGFGGELDGAGGLNGRVDAIKSRGFEVRKY